MSESQPIIEQPNTTSPAALVEIALKNNAPIEQLEKLMDMQLRWEANEARKAFVVAMSEFRKEAPTLEKQTQGHNYVYTSLDHITAKVNPLLSKHGLSFGWVTEQGDRITVHCDVTHVGGHSARTSLSGPPDTSGQKNAIQAIGSTVSYLQRYTLLGALGLSTGGMDNDGQAEKPEQVKVINPDQLSGLNKMLKTHDVESAFDEWLKGHGVEKREDIPASSYGNAIKKVNSLMKAKNADS